MSRIARLSAVALVLWTAACASAPPAEPEPTPPAQAEAQPPAQASKLRLGVVGDQTGASDLDAAYRVLAQGVERLDRYHREVAPLDVVLHVGDLVESTAEPEEVRRRFGQAVARLDRLPTKWYLAAGDHDVNPPVYRQNSPDRSREDLFKRLYGPRIPGGQGTLWYSLDIGPHHLVVLYAEQALHTDPRWGDVFLAQIQDDQLDWLRRDLEAHSGAAGTIVLLHQPQWYHWGSWQRVHELLRRHPVALVLSGHFHYQQDGGTIDGIRYLTVGATGGDTKSGSVQAGDVQHVSVIEVQGREVTRVELLPLDAPSIELAPRREMDRVQALDVMLGNLWSLPAKNKVYRWRDRLVAACDTLLPARVTVAGLGNPIDRPVRIEISASAPVRLVDAAFAAGMCVRGGATTCEATPVPTPNLFSSNDSGVAFDEAASLWSTTVESAAGTLPQAVELRFRVGYQPDSPIAEPLALERTQSIPVVPCSGP